MAIRAAAFDYGGVISFPQEENDMTDLAAIAGISLETMRRFYWEYRPGYDRGDTGGEYFRKVLAAAGVHGASSSLLEQLVARDVESWSRINPETAGLMRGIKNAGLKLGLLSNMIQPFLDRAAADIPVLALPDAAVYSCEIRAVKPEPLIYQRLLAALGCGADELVFFDDMPVNVEGARKLGIRAFLWEGVDQARRELEKLGTGKLM